MHFRVGTAHRHALQSEQSCGFPPDFRINGDLGRLGGLLKLWLTNDERAAAFGESTIRALLEKFEHTQGEIVEVVREVVMPKAKR